MSKINRKQALLLLSAVLLLVKFALQPFLEWQESKAANIYAMQQQLTKGQALLEKQSELRQQLFRTRAAQQKILSDVAAVDVSSASFQLNTQKKVDALLQEYQLEADNISWQQPLDKDYGIEHRLEIRLSGDFRQQALFWIALESMKPKVTVLESTSSISDMSASDKDMGDFLGRMLLSFWQQKGGIQ